MRHTPQEERTELVGIPLPDTSETQGLELTSALGAVRAQLSEAMRAAEGERLQFELGDVEMEFTVTMSQEAKVDGGVKVWVVNAGGSKATTTGTTHKIKVTLKPRDRQSGQPPIVADHLGTIPPR